MEKAIFNIDDMMFVEGIHNPKRYWNGWACPMFPLESVEVIAEFLKPQLNDKDCLSSGALTLMVYGVPCFKSLDDETQTVESILPITPKVIDGVDYYDVSDGWVWDVLTVPDFGDDDESRDYWVGLVKDCPFKSAGVMATITGGK